MNLSEALHCEQQTESKQTFTVRSLHPKGYKMFLSSLLVDAFGKEKDLSSPKSRGTIQSNNYWSSSTYAQNTDNAWNVNFNNGNVNNNNKTNNNYVRCVTGA